MNESVVLTGKSFMGICATILGFMWDSFNGAMVVLAIFMVLDYLTGVIASALYKNKPWDWNVAIRGFVRKLFTALLIPVAMMVDYVLISLGKGVGLEYTKTVMTLAATFYLIGIEGYSLLQNFIIIGVPVPDFMLKVFGLMKDQAGKIVKLDGLKGPGNV